MGEERKIEGAYGAKDYNEVEGQEEQVEEEEYNDALLYNIYYTIYHTLGTLLSLCINNTLYTIMYIQYTITRYIVTYYAVEHTE